MTVHPWRLTAAGLLIPALLAVSACGSKSAVTSGSPAAKASASAQATTAASTGGSTELLYAVVESHTKLSNGFQTYDTVAVAGLDGYARAKATFTPLTPPYVGCAGPLLPLQAHVAAGKVFYIDGKGIVRSLGLDKTPKQVASFPIGSQQEASFAVSPDGRHLLATVLTFPAKPAGDPCTGQGTGFAPGDWSEDVYAADSGGASHLISHRSWPQTQPENVLALVGWDAHGPLGTFPTSYATQGGGPSREGWYGAVVRLDAVTGTIQRTLGSDNCFVYDVAADGSSVCAGADGIDVLSPDGVISWKWATAPNQGYGVPFLSPDLRHVEALGPIVIGRDGSATPIDNFQPNGNSFGSFFCSGWLDNQTLIGWNSVGTTYNEMTIVRLSAPAQLVDLGFRGTFLGVVQNA